MVQTSHNGYDSTYRRFAARVGTSDCGGRGMDRPGEGEGHEAGGGERHGAGDAERDQTTDERDRVEEILRAAEQRDDQADARDSEAYRRDMATNLEAFVHRVDDDEAYQARSLAAKDRARARADRVASKLDRHLLTGLSPNADEREAASASQAEAADGAQEVDDNGDEPGDDS
jgi:hypothetical protein